MLLRMAVRNGQSIINVIANIGQNYIIDSGETNYDKTIWIPFILSKVSSMTLV